MPPDTDTRTMFLRSIAINPLLSLRCVNYARKLAWEGNFLQELKEQTVDKSE